MVREEIELVMFLKLIKRIFFIYSIYYKFLLLVFFSCFKIDGYVSLSDLWMYMFKENLFVFYLYVYIMYVLLFMINGKILKSL